MPIWQGAPISTTATRGDVYGNNLTSTTSAPVDNTQVYFGFTWDGFSFQFWSGFYRFEVDIPDNAVINGVRLKITLISGHAAKVWDVNCSVLDPAHPTGGKFALAAPNDGYTKANYPARPDLPHVEFTPFGTPSEPEVQWESTPAFTLNWTNPSGVGFDASFMDGTLVGDSPTGYDVTGLGFKEKIQSYFAAGANTALRDNGVGDGVPLGISLWFPQQPLPLDTYATATASTAHANSAYHPFLKIDWEEPPPTTGFGATAQSDAVAQVAARSGTLGQVSAQSDVVSMAQARSDAQPQVTASSDVVDQVKARGD
jgi:hypothetical protein